MAPRFETKDLVVWSVPLTIAAVAGVFAWRAYRQPEWAPTPELRLIEPCAPGHYRCRGGHVETTTGAPGDSGPLSCEWKETASCTRTCTTEVAMLAGVDAKTAREQLCDPPKRPLALLARTDSFLDAPVADAGSCEGDGYIPIQDGFLQCVSKAADRLAPGVVIAHSHCLIGAIKTLELRPQLITREAAAALWCRRDPIAEIEPAVDAMPGDAMPGDAMLGDAMLEAGDAMPDADARSETQ